jgi:hypothetical protein
VSAAAARNAPEHTVAARPGLLNPHSGDTGGLLRKIGGLHRGVPAIMAA